MASEMINLGSFWPGWDKLFAFDFSSTDGVTAFFILAILFLTTIFVGYLLYFAKRYYARVNFYLGQLKGLSSDDVRGMRRTFVANEEEAYNKKKKVIDLRLWKEFDETLLEHNGYLYNNLDAEHFFNGSTLASCIADSRLFPTGASVITGVGVLGTFFGLQLGLSGLNLDGDISMIQGEIRLLAQSASVAFITSVWGVGVSLFLNLFEKLLHGCVLRKISELQSKVDDLFPRFPITGTFANIEEHSKNSVDSLNVLAEQIGKQMQTQLSSFSAEMTTSLATSISNAASTISSTIGGTLKSTIEETLVPAVESMADVTRELADKQAKGSEEAMAGLLERFMDAMGQEGQGQRDAMQNASNEIRDAMSGLTSSMDGFFASLKEQQVVLNEEQDARAKVLEASVKELVEYQSEALETTNRKMSEMLEAFAENLGSEQARQADSLSSASGDVKEAISELAGGMNQFFEELGSQQQAMIAEQDERTRALEAAVQRMVNEQAETQHESSAKVSEMLHDFLSRMDEVQVKQAGSLGDASEGVREVLTDMGGTLSSFMDSLDSAQIRLREEQDSRSNDLEQLVSDTTTSVASLLVQGEQLQQHVYNSTSALDSVTSRMNKTGDAFSDATANLKQVSNEISASTGRAASSIESAVATAEQLFAENSSVAKGLEGTLRSLEDIKGTVESVTSELRQAASTSGESFESLSVHYKELQSSMQNHVEDLEKELSNLLYQYSNAVQTQVQDRMTSWDSQTKSFCDSMSSVVQAMGEVVENMDNLPSKN